MDIKRLRKAKKIFNKRLDKAIVELRMEFEKLNYREYITFLIYRRHHSYNRVTKLAVEKEIKRLCNKKGE